MRNNDAAEEIIRGILPFSRYAQRLLESEPELRTELLQNLHKPFLREAMQAFLQADAAAANGEAGLHSILRRLRKRVMLRLIARDLGGLADLAEVMAGMTALAEITIGFALERHQTWLSDPERYGSPQGADSGEIQKMLVIGMGKLGGGELNVSSDVDLIFVYPEDGETSGSRPISNHDFFARLGRKLIASLNDITADGYVFRVDMRLRPYGESGPLAMSFAMLEEYLVTQGREWERYAWIKSRLIAGPGEAELMKLAQPFVFRKYLDFSAYASMRGLHSQIRQEVRRREMHDNIKLGPGGIREIEFIAQVFQLIRGGRDAELRIHPTLAVLQRLRKKRQLPDKAVAELSDAYSFLRNLEHRLQYLDDQQTQTLPENSADQALIAAAMSFPGYADFLQQLDIHRGNVIRHFELVFAAPEASQARDALAWLWQEQTGGKAETGSKTTAATTQLSAMGFADPVKIFGHLQQFRGSSRYRQLPESSQQRIDALVPALIEVAARFPPADPTLERLLGLLESVSRRAAYLALLLEYPQALERVAKLASTSLWASEYLSQHPILLDELLDPASNFDDALNVAPDWPGLRTELLQQLNQVNDRERQMDILRHFQHAQLFRLLVKDLEGLLPLETLSDHLTALADLVLDTALRLAWSGLSKKHRDQHAASERRPRDPAGDRPVQTNTDSRYSNIGADHGSLHCAATLAPRCASQPAFAIIGYGKLGGKELGYVSDLDIIFLYDDPHPDAPEIYARLAQRINSWLSSRTSAGLLYETDLRLRPDGAAGLLVSSVEAFAQYQQQQAWVWEHQALTRARFVVGDAHVGEAFERIRREVICQRRDLPKLKHEVLMMRQKMLDAHPNPSELFDIKHDRGGIIDVEFMVQYLVLGHACDHPELTGNIGNIALLKLAGKLGLIPLAAAATVSSAYREFRRVQHRLRLGGESQKFARIEAGYLSDARTAVLQLWKEVFGS